MAVNQSIFMIENNLLKFLKYYIYSNLVYKIGIGIGNRYKKISSSIVNVHCAYWYTSDMKKFPF